MSVPKKPPFPKQQRPVPGFTAPMVPTPQRRAPYRASGLDWKRAIITGGDSGIGRAVALAFACEGSNLLISYLSEEEDAEVTRRLIEETLGEDCVSGWRSACRNRSTLLVFRLSKGQGQG